MIPYLKRFKWPKQRVFHCQRCDRWFGDTEAILQHYKNHSGHHYCAICKFDGRSHEDLVRHHESAQHRRQQGNGAIAVQRSVSDADDRKEDIGNEYEEDGEDEGEVEEEKDEYDEQLEIYYDCEDNDCEDNDCEDNDCEDNDKPQCFGCGQYYETHGDVFNHLEKNRCSSTVRRIDMYAILASEQYWKDFINASRRRDMMRKLDVQLHRPHVFAFRCPACGENFSTFTRLVDHAEDDVCRQDVFYHYVNSLINWLADQFHV